MKLVAVKRISQQLQVGSVFEESTTRARLLIALGVATPHVDAPTGDPAPAAAERVVRSRRGPRRSEGLG